MIRSDILRCLHSWKIYVSFACGLALMLHPLLRAWPFRDGFSPMSMLSIPLATSDFTPFASMFCVLPFAESFCEDLNSGFAFEITQRIGAKQYARKRVLSTALSGGIVTALIMLVTIIVCCVGAGQPDTTDTVAFMNNSIWGKLGILTTAHGSILYALRVFVAFLFGMLWALVGMCVSVLIPNRYVTLIAPFVLYQMLWFLLDETAVNPVYMFRGDSNYIPSFVFLVCWQVAWLAFCALFSYIGMTRRIYT